MPDMLSMAHADMYDYGEEVLKGRAIPDYRDGLKPVHRRILWTCYEMGLKASGGTKKSARVVGECLGKFHPHGDASIYQALVGMTSANSPEPLIHSQGNFGGIESSAAAMRYTEAKLTKFSEKYLLDPDYLAVMPLVPNYDNTESEPVFLPSKLPNLFLQGTEGIAYGCSNMMPSFTKESVIKLVKKALSGKEINGKLLEKNLQFKFTYGGECISSPKDIRHYFETGFARLEFAAKMAKGKKDNTIVINSLAPRIKPSKLEGALVKMKDVANVDMEKTRTSVTWFQVTVKKNADFKSVYNRIHNECTTALSFQTYITDRREEECTDDNGETFNKVEVVFIKTSPVGVLQKWIKWRLEFEKKVISRLIGLEQVQIQKITWLIWACNNLKLIMKALESKNPDAYIVKNGKITAEAADFILSQQVRRLAHLEIKGLKEKRTAHDKKKSFLEKDKNNKTRLVDRVIATL